MSPYEQAAQVYLRERCARSFTEDVELHLMHGFVHSTPAYFIMGRPVIRTAPAWQIVDPAHTFARADCDTWMVYLAAGDLGRAWDVLPWPLPWLAFERKNELRFLPAEAVSRLSNGKQYSTAKSLLSGK